MIYFQDFYVAPHAAFSFLRKLWLKAVINSHPYQIIDKKINVITNQCVASETGPVQRLVSLDLDVAPLYCGFVR